MKNKKALSLRYYQSQRNKKRRSNEIQLKDMHVVEYKNPNFSANTEQNLSVFVTP